MDELIKALGAQAAAIHQLAREVRSLSQQTKTLILALAEQELDEVPETAGFFLDGTPK